MTVTKIKTITQGNNEQINQHNQVEINYTIFSDLSDQQDQQIIHEQKTNFKFEINSEIILTELSQAVLLMTKNEKSIFQFHTKLTKKKITSFYFEIELLSYSTRTKSRYEIR